MLSALSPVFMICPPQHLGHHSFLVLDDERPHGEFGADELGELFQSGDGGIPIFQPKQLDKIGKNHVFKAISSYIR